MTNTGAIIIGIATILNSGAIIYLHRRIEAHFKILSIVSEALKLLTELKAEKRHSHD